jgi:hypothetical protein
MSRSSTRPPVPTWLHPAAGVAAAAVCAGVRAARPGGVGGSRPDIHGDRLAEVTGQLPDSAVPYPPARVRLAALATGQREPHPGGPGWDGDGGRAAGLVVIGHDT